MDVKPDLTIFIQFFNLLVVLVFLNFFLFRPVLRALSKREDAITSSVVGAKSLEEDTRNLEKAYDDGLREKKRPVIETRDAMISEAHNTSLRMIEEARAELNEELSKIRSKIAEESHQVLEKLKMDVDRLSGEAAERIIQRSL